MKRSAFRRAAQWLLPFILALAFSGLIGPAGADPPRGLVVLRPASGPARSPFEVVGFGFDDGQRVEVRWDGVDGQLLAVGVGRDFTLPAVAPAAEPGLHTVVVISRDADSVVGTASSDAFLVTAGDAADAAPAAASGDGSDLAGGDEEGVKPTSGVVWAAVGAGLTALAAALAWARVRRRAAPADAAVQDG